MRNQLTSCQVALIQNSCSLDAKNNINKALQSIEEAGKNGSQLIVLQELFASPYFCQEENSKHFSYAEQSSSERLKQFAEIAKKLKIVLVYPFFEKRAAGLYHNSVHVIESDGSIAGTYRKMHIPDDPGFYEKYYFAPGDLGFEPIETSVGKLGLLICWDQWFPEAARIMALKGAELLIYPTAIGWEPEATESTKKKELEAWQIIQRSHSVANNLPMLSCNRVGLENLGESSINFWGSSFITGSQGEILSQASLDKEEIIYATIDKQQTEITRQAWPYFRDRRIDSYNALQKLWGEN
ncbi:MAG TPA: carbon-nitrogen hydrolase [Vampirovibrionales bacterium]